MLRKRITATGSALVLAALAAPAALADGEPKSFVAPVASKSSWSGFYFGIGGGAGNVDQSVSTDASKTTQIDKFKKVPKFKEITKTIKNCHFVPYWPYSKCVHKPITYHVPDGYEYQQYDSDTKYASKSDSFQDDAWHAFGTLQFGADYQIHDRFLIGAFVDVDIYRDAESSFSSKNKLVSTSSRLGVDRVWNVGGRIGIIAHNNFLLYGVGGYSKADIDNSTLIDFKHGPDFKFVPDDRLKGYFVGGGGEWKFHKNVALKLEYRYAKYDGESASASATKEYVDYDHFKKYEVTKHYNASASYDTDIHSIRGVLVFRFDDATPDPAALK